MNLIDRLRELRESLEDPQSLPRRTLDALSQLGPVLDASERSDAPESDQGPSGHVLLSLLSQLAQPPEADGQAGSGIGGLQGDKGDQVDHLTYNELVHQNSVVAAALGACDCWGERANCPLCKGVGSPGWMPADENLFDIYVRPVVHQFSTEAV
jgi:hypothetical protein